MTNSFEPYPATDECWEIREAKGQIILSSTRLGWRMILNHGAFTVADTVAFALAAATGT